MTKDKKDKQDLQRHKFFTGLAHPVTYLTSYKVNFVHQSKKMYPGANLILANHVLPGDFLYVHSAYPAHIYYVVGENVFRNPRIRKFMEWSFGVIPHLRGVSSLNTIKQMAVLLKKGRNVCIFPEGTMSFDGKTRPVDASIAKLAKMSGANLILLTFEGAYFTKPRWGVTGRRGKMTVREKVLMAEELKTLSAGEISTIINESLYTDAYQLQEKEPVRFKGKKLCKGLESCVYECPSCGEVAKLTTTDSTINCNCDFCAIYDEYGYLTDKNENRYTIAQLCENQKENLRKKADNVAEHVLLFTDRLECSKLSIRNEMEPVGTVTLSAYSDKIECEYDGHTITVEYSQIEGVYIIMRNTLDCVVSGTAYELRGDFSFNALKYRDLYDIKNEQ